MKSNINKVSDVCVELILIEFFRVILTAIITTIPALYFFSSFMPIQGGSLYKTAASDTLIQLIRLNPTFMSISVICSSISVVLSIFIIYCYFKKNKFSSLLKITNTKFFLAIKQIFLGILTGALLFGLSITVLFVYNKVSFSTTINLDINTLSNMSYLLLIAIIAILCEEFFYRGYIMSRLEYKYMPIISCIISCAIYLIMSMLNNELGVWSIINLVLINLLCCLFFLFSNNIFIGVGFRTIWVYLSSLILGVKLFFVDQKIQIFEYVLNDNKILRTAKISGFISHWSITIILLLVSVLLLIIYYLQNNKKIKVT